MEKKVNVFLDNNKPGKKSGNKLIYISIYHQNWRFRRSIGQSINPEEWDKSKQRAYEISEKNKILNSNIDYLSNVLLDFYKNAIDKKVNIDIKYLHSHMKKYRIVNEKILIIEDEISVEFYFNEFLRFKGILSINNIKKRSAQKYSYLLKKIKTFAIKANIPFLLKNIDEKFYLGFVDWEKKNKRSELTLLKEISVLKAFLNYCVSKDYILNGKFISSLVTTRKEDNLVYIFRVIGYNRYKIGHTDTLSVRFRRVDTSMPFYIEKIATYVFNDGIARQFENWLHKKYEKFRMKGKKEWFEFELTDNELQEIQNIYDTKSWLN